MANSQEHREVLMAENLREKLAMAVKKIQWSYAIFWSSSSTEPGVLKWCDGYYNGDIKTRKTIQAMEMKDDEDEVGFQRTEQLRELYESLSESNPHELTQSNHIKRPSAALSPEDLTDTEWYFLVCMSFEFIKGQGLPGRSLATNTTIWLCNANFADSKVFSRSLLAKSASIQTVVCFPYLEGVVELGITEKVSEEQDMINQIKASIFDVPSQNVLKIPCNILDHDLIDKNLDTILERDKKHGEDSCKVEDVNVGDSRGQSWKFIDDEEDEVSFFQNNSMGSSDCISQNLVCGPNLFSDIRSDDDSHYQRVLSTIFKSTRRLILGPQLRNYNVKESAFLSWKKSGGVEWRAVSSQMLLKKMLYEVPKMHGNHSFGTRDDNGNQERLWRPEADDANNNLLEQRREKINEKFSILGSLVPSGGKVDKASLLDDTIEYLKTLKKRIEDLESNKHIGDLEVKKTKRKSHDIAERTSDNYGNYAILEKKRKGSCDVKYFREDRASDCITVSVVEKNVTVEIRCQWRENMMIQVLDAMSNLPLVSHSLQSDVVDGILSLTIESKLTGCTIATSKMIRQALQRVLDKC